MTKADWTVNPETGRSNSSEQFEKLTIEVARLIRGSAHELIAGNAGTVAHFIMAQLAHVHGMRPNEADLSLRQRPEPKYKVGQRVQCTVEARSFTVTHVRWCECWTYCESKGGTIWWAEHVLIPEITCLADIEQLVAEDVKQSGKPGPRIVTIGTKIQNCLASLEASGRIPFGTLSFRGSDQLVLLRSHHAIDYLSIERASEEKEEPKRSSTSTNRCWLCQITDVTEKLTVTSKSYGWSALGDERAHEICANTWRELTAGNRTDLLCAVLCDFYYSTEGVTDISHYADQLCETLRQLGLIYQSSPKDSPWSAYYSTDLGKAFFKKVLVAPWYKPTALQAQVDRLALYAVNAGLTPHWLYLGRKQQQELADWLPSTPQNLVNKFHTAGGMIEVIRLRATDELSLHGYVSVQTGVKEYGKPITLETVANQK